MKIHGFQKTTLLDYPGLLAATVFTGGCNFRCPFCHNGGLVCHPEDYPLIPEEEVFAHLKKRQGLLKGVCITGGEPTLQEDLPEFAWKIRKLGYLVKLDTNGYRPDVLKDLMRRRLVDYVAMDVKSSLHSYAAACGIAAVCTDRISESVELLKHSTIPYEFRTTVVKGIHRPEDFEEIGSLLSGCRVYYLQNFRDDGNVMRKGYGSFDREELIKIADIARKYIDKVEIRGVE